MKNQITDKATARPWRTVGGSWSGQIMADIDGNPYGICKCAGETPEERRANAALIVRAVNEYDALCAVAEAAMQCELAMVRDALSNLTKIKGE